LPSSFEDGDFKRWLLHFEVCAEANGWSDTIKAKKLPTFLKGDALIIFLDCPAAVKSYLDDWGKYAIVRSPFATIAGPRLRH
ncbi:hypothetical protein T09_5012, partial [Trichinella sp. T9]